MKIKELFEQTVGTAPTSATSTLTGTGVSALSDPKMQAMAQVQMKKTRDEEKKNLRQQIQSLQQQIRDLQNQQSALNRAP